MPADARLLMMDDARRQLADGQSGFLGALTDLIHEAVANKQASGQALPPRAFVYDGETYEMTARPVSSQPLELGGRTYEQTLEVAFAVRDGGGQQVGDFDITLGTTGAEAEVPLRAVYRPNWWVELEILRASSSAAGVGHSH